MQDEDDSIIQSYIKDFLNDINTNCQRQNSSSKLLRFFVNDILDFTQIKMKKLKMDIHEFNLTKAVEEVVSIQVDQAQSKQITIEIFYHWFNDSATMITSDMRRLQQVLLNLLSNAIKFTNKLGVINIYCKMIKNQEGEDTHVQIQVKDNGVGITKKEQKNLFKLFGTIKSTRESNTQGVGLGLCISQMIVQIFEGQLEIESELNKGATFTFTFKVFKNSNRSPNTLRQPATFIDNSIIMEDQIIKQRKQQLQNQSVNSDFESPEKMNKHDFGKPMFNERKMIHTHKSEPVWIDDSNILLNNRSILSLNNLIDKFQKEDSLSYYQNNDKIENSDSDEQIIQNDYDDEEQIRTMNFEYQRIKSQILEQNTSNSENGLAIQSKSSSSTINEEELYIEEFNEENRPSLAMPKKGAMASQDKDQQRLLQIKMVKQGNIQKLQEAIPEILIIDDQLFNIDAVKILLNHCRKGMVNKFDSAIDGQDGIE